MAEIQQLPKKQPETWQKQLFLALFFPFFYLLLHGQVKALFYVPIKSKSGKRATRAWPSCEPSWMWYLRYEKICLLPEGIQSISLLKATYFPLSIVYCFYSMYFIIGVIVKFLLQQRLQLSSTCRRVATRTSRTEAVVYVIKRRSLWFSDDSE